MFRILLLSATFAGVECGDHTSVLQLSTLHSSTQKGWNWQCKNSCHKLDAIKCPRKRDTKACFVKDGIPEWKCTRRCTPNPDKLCPKRVGFELTCAKEVRHCPVGKLPRCPLTSKLVRTASTTAKNGCKMQTFKCEPVCAQPMCRNTCEKGRAKDINGCETCSCVECPVVMPGPCPSTSKLVITGSTPAKNGCKIPTFKCEPTCAQAMCRNKCYHGPRAKDINGCETCTCVNCPVAAPFPCPSTSKLVITESTAANGCQVQNFKCEQIPTPFPTPCPPQWRPDCPLPHNLVSKGSITDMNGCKIQHFECERCALPLCMNRCYHGRVYNNGCETCTCAEEKAVK